MPRREFLARAAMALVLLAAPATIREARADAFETPARHLLLIDDTTGTILLEKEADTLMPPSSMSKLMTAYMVFDRLAQGTLKPEDKFSVSERAWRMGGSKMFVELGSQIAISDLLRGIIIQSGNDACVVVAEGLASSEEAFAEQMTAKAREIGLTASTFRNATGWPDPQHLMTTRDLATLARHIIHDFPQYYPIYSERSFTWHGITQENRNPTLGRVDGADGLKTGHTEAAGYGLVASVKRGDRRLILVMNGLNSQAQRRSESERVLEWGYREFEMYRLASAGKPVGTAKVWLGTEDTVPLVADGDLRVTLRRTSRPGMVARIVYDGPVEAPIAKGQEIAKLEITAPDMPPMAIPLHAAVEVPRTGPFGRVFAAIGYLLFGAAS
ncbi:D-alanyl-D-alanine carboxypeptidase family protein [Zavarzinia sp. CC-PAN008]|uniref:D-alanyl-D-alanine carboxypeptidase family protein n=1 Tax=Zavarzinia sp. CC-PAN008 TaxID=3243332 RepID=UPI003F743C4B